MRVLKGLAQATLMAWILWMQNYPVVELNDKITVNTTGDGVWRYREGFDAKQSCLERRKLLIGEQDAKLASLTPDSPDLDKFTYREYRCYPETIDPWELLRYRPYRE